VAIEQIANQEASLFIGYFTAFSEKSGQGSPVYPCPSDEIWYQMRRDWRETQPHAKLTDASAPIAPPSNAS
jgi:hypothetical protein